jgi:2-oxoglutarate dehydrogenase E2 component (dihydrolipoamide succinyltransferase)
MATDIVIPNVGESVTSGVIATWLKGEGDYVERDEAVLELETDKVTMEVTAPASGTLKRMADEGDEVEVGAVVGAVDESAEKPEAAAAGTKKSAGAAEGRADSGDEDDRAPDKGAPASGGDRSRESGEKAEADADGARSGKSGGGRPDTGEKPRGDKSGGGKAAGRSGEASRDRPGDVRATPLAERIAKEQNVDLSRVVGTGAGGRIREHDVLAFVQSARSSNGTPASAEGSGGTSRATSRKKMTPLRQRVASRLVEAQRTAAMLTTFNECDMSAVMALRKRYKEDFAEKHGVGLGFMSFFVKAAVNALQAVPMANAQIVEENGAPAIQTHDYCDIAIAVASPKGLVVPVIRNAETLSFAGIESAVKDLGTRARDGKLDLSELQGGTFTITNGGVFGSLMSTPILNPPQSAILGMHAIKNRAVEHPEKPGEVAVRPMMYLALSYDHRIIDGAEAVTFLVHIKNAIERPERLMLGL